MKASQTELLTLFKQAFEGIGFDAGGYENAADMVVWAEMHGLKVFDQLPARLERLRGSAAPSIEIRSDAAGTLMIDAAEASALACGELISSAVFASAVNTGICKATISRIHDRQLMAKKIADCGNRGAHCLGYWQDAAQQDLVHAIASDPNERCLQISVYQTQVELEPDTLYLVYAMKLDSLQKHVLEHCKFVREQPVSRLEPEALQSTFQQSLNDGIEITDTLWRSLHSLAAGVLVESSEHSRKGAGA